MLILYSIYKWVWISFSNIFDYSLHACNSYLFILLAHALQVILPSFVSDGLLLINGVFKVPIFSKRLFTKVIARKLFLLTELWAFWIRILRSYERVQIWNDPLRPLIFEAKSCVCFQKWDLSPIDEFWLFWRWGINKLREVWSESECCILTLIDVFSSATLLKGVQVKVHWSVEVLVPVRWNPVNLSLLCHFWIKAVLQSASLSKHSWWLRSWEKANIAGFNVWGLRRGLWILILVIRRFHWNKYPCSAPLTRLLQIWIIYFAQYFLVRRGKSPRNDTSTLACRRVVCKVQGSRLNSYSFKLNAIRAMPNRNKRLTSSGFWVFLLFLSSKHHVAHFYLFFKFIKIRIIIYKIIWFIFF